MGKEYKYVVATQCVTFNHAAYILDTLHGFTIQETDFPTVYCVVDDASTDGEQAVLKDWANEHLKVADDEKLWCEQSYGLRAVGHLVSDSDSLFVILLLKENHYSSGQNKKKYSYIEPWCNDAKYLAYCEGDDYWIDSQKLKNQVRVLDANPETTLVYSSFKTVDENGVQITRPMYEGFKKSAVNGEALYLLLRRNFIISPTICMRNKMVQEKLYINCPVIMDWSSFLVAAMFGDLYYLPDETSSYRKVGSSMVNSHRDIVDNRGRVIKAYYSEEYLRAQYKRVSFIEHCRILHSIADTCIVDRNWGLLKSGVRHPYFMLIFSEEFIVHLINKCLKVSKSIFHSAKL